MKKIFILFSLIFIMLIFLSLSFVQAQEYQQSIGPAGCTKTGAFITISGFFSVVLGRIYVMNYVVHQTVVT